MIRTLTRSRTFIAATAACVCAFGAAQAYASDGQSAVLQTKATSSQIVSTDLETQPEARLTIYRKTAISENPPIIRANDAGQTIISVTEPLPDLVVPLNTDMGVTADAATIIREPAEYQQARDLRRFDLIEDSPVFLGAQGVSEFDTLDARRDAGSYPESLNVDPFYTVAGAGIETSF